MVLLILSAYILLLQLRPGQCPSLRWPRAKGASRPRACCDRTAVRSTHSKSGGRRWSRCRSDSFWTGRPAASFGAAFSPFCHSSRGCLSRSESFCLFLECTKQSQIQRRLKQSSIQRNTQFWGKDNVFNRGTYSQLKTDKTRFCFLLRLRIF